MSGASDAQFVERRPRTEHMPRVDHQPGGGMACRINDLRAHGYRRNGGERHRLNGHPCPARGCLVGQFAERADQRQRIGGDRTVLRADLDEGRSQSAISPKPI
jgi:hypothetical protein